MFGTHYLDQHAAESSNCDIEQVSNRQSCRYEINADHRSNLKIDKQEEDVSEARATFGGHADESCSG
jgi:hypothetical protein